MNYSRRDVLAFGGGLAALATMATAGGEVVISMRGTARGEHVWFSPQGLAIAPGTPLRFVNDDPGNSHTATAYHPSVLDRPLRIPEMAKPWDSDFLLPGQSFSLTLTVPGVYDYCCQPHEMAGMVGRIIVGHPGDAGWQGPSPESGDLMPEVLAAFPSVEVILNAGRIEAKGI
ncbi:plastocyanin/azurin family copper-binding protein [Paracoccus cavernae]